MRGFIPHVSPREPVEKSRRRSNDEKWIGTSCSARIVAFSSERKERSIDRARASGLVDSESREKPRGRDCHFLRGELNLKFCKFTLTHTHTHTEWTRMPVIFLFNHFNMTSFLMKRHRSCTYELYYTFVTRARSIYHHTVNLVFRNRSIRQHLWILRTSYTEYFRIHPFDLHDSANARARTSL